MVLRGLAAINGRLERVVCGIIIFLMALMTGVVWLQVFQRYVMNASLSWSEEAARYLMIWVSFLGASIALRRGQHISMELLRARLRPVLRRGAVVLSEGLMLTFWAVIVGFGLRYALENLNQQATALPIAYGYVYFGIPLGAGLMALQTAENLLRALAGAEVGTGAARPEGKASKCSP